MAYIYKIRNKDNGLFKRKGNGHYWHKDGDTYSTLGIARSAASNILFDLPSLRLEMVCYDLQEIGICLLTDRP